MERVRELRELRMLSQQELADRAGVSLFTIQRIERGEGSVRPKTGRAVASALGVSAEELLPKAQAPLPFEGPAPAGPAERRIPPEAAAALGPIADHMEWRRRSLFGAFLLDAAEGWASSLADPDLGHELVLEFGAAARTLEASLRAYLDDGKVWGELSLDERNDAAAVVRSLAEATKAYDLRTQEATDGEEQEANPRQSTAGWK